MRKVSRKIVSFACCMILIATGFYGVLDKSGIADNDEGGVRKEK